MCVCVCVCVCVYVRVFGIHLPTDVVYVPFKQTSNFHAYKAFLGCFQGVAAVRRVGVVSSSLIPSMWPIKMCALCSLALLLIVLNYCFLNYASAKVYGVR